MHTYAENYEANGQLEKFPRQGLELSRAPNVGMINVEFRTFTTTFPPKPSPDRNNGLVGCLLAKKTLRHEETHLLYAQCDGKINGLGPTRIKRHARKKRNVVRDQQGNIPFRHRAYTVVRATPPLPICHSLLVWHLDIEGCSSATLTVSPS